VTQHLVDNQIMTIEIHEEPVTVHVALGTVWVTQERDRIDYVLETPATHTFWQRGRLVIQALGYAQVECSSTSSRWRRAG
jgi:hypothetical protein